MPCWTASALPPTSVATTGRLAAIASTMAFEKPSLREGRTKISAAARQARGLLTPPRKRMFFSRPRVEIRVSSSSR